MFFPVVLGEMLEKARPNQDFISASATSDGLRAKDRQDQTYEEYRFSTSGQSGSDEKERVPERSIESSILQNFCRNYRYEVWPSTSTY